MKTFPARYALIGKSGAGKSEVAKILQSHCSCNIIKTGQICRDISQMLFGNDDKRSTQTLDDALTPIDESIFLRASMRGIDTSQPFVIDSLRFISDLTIARSLNCFLLRVVADDHIRLARLANRGQQFDLSKDGSHRSEVELDAAEVTETINNNGAFSDLEASALRAISLHQ